MKNRLGWRWKLVIVFIALFIFSIGFVLSPWGVDCMKGWIDSAYVTCPADQRMDSPAADYFLALAWWQATIRGKEQDGMNLYREFLGILPSNNQPFWFWYDDEGAPKWSGKFDGQTKKGWGILHPRACDAYWEYLQVFQPLNSASFTGVEAYRYKILFYDIYSEYNKDGKPHPKFYRYWNKISQRMIAPAHMQVPPVDPAPPGYEGPEP